MKRIIILIASLCVLSLLITGCSTPANRTVNDLVFEKKISDFNLAGSLEQWQTEDNATLTRECLPDGSYTAVLNLPKYVSGPAKWPLMQLNTKHGLPEDWSDYDALRLDCRKQSPLLVLLGIFVADNDGGKTWLKPALDRSTWQTVQLPLANQKLNLDSMNRLRIYVTTPGADMKINIKNIKLVSFLPQKFKKLSAAYREFGASKEADYIDSVFQQLNNRTLSLAEGKQILAKYEQDIRITQKDYLRKQFRQLYPGVDYAVLFADSMSRVMPHQGLVPGKVPDHYSVPLAQNEYEAFQAVVIPPYKKGLKDVSISVSSDNKQLEKSIQVAPVGFVKSRQPIYPVDYIGWYPDPILEFTNHVTIKKDDVQPFWIRIYAKNKLGAGTYQCQLNVQTADEKPLHIPFAVKIYDFEIPKKGHLRTAISLYPSKLLPHGPQMYQAYDYVLDKYRLNPFSIYADSAYGKPKIHPINEYTKRLKLGLNAIPLVYLKLPRQALHKSSAQSKAKWEALPAKEKLKYPEKEARNIMEILARRVPELKKAGLYDMAYCYGMDEATAGEWQACADLCKQIKAAYPDLKIYSTAYDQSYGTKSVLKHALDGWIPHDNLYDPELAQKVRKQGKEVWWYSTRMFVDEKPLWEVRSMMGDKAFKLKVDGFLYWTISRWNGVNDKPINNAPYTDWNPMTFNGHNGGGSFLCMGPGNQLLPTIRLENIRDGLEDYEYLYKLKELVNKTPKTKKGSAYQQAVKLLNAAAVKGVKAIRDERNLAALLISKLQ